MKNLLLEIMYVLCGLVSVVTAVYAIRDKEHPSAKITSLFWLLLGVVFIFGNYIPGYVSGIILVVMSILSATKRFSLGHRRIQTMRLEKRRQKTSATNCLFRHWQLVSLHF